MSSVLDVARSNLGEVGGDQWWEKERPQFKGMPWAAPFVLAVADEAGHDTTSVRDPDLPYHLTAMYNTAKRNGAVIHGPAAALPGDIVISWPLAGLPNMVGVLERVDGNTFHLIGGDIARGGGPEQVDRYVRPRGRTAVIRTKPERSIR